MGGVKPPLALQFTNTGMGKSYKADIFTGI